MDTIILLFLLATLDKNASAKDSILSMLKFYRENRELFAMLSQNGAFAAKTPPQETERETKKESRPSAGADSLNILEEFLNRSAVQS